MPLSGKGSCISVLHNASRPAWTYFLRMLRRESYVGTYMVQCSKNLA
jgi:hypothetical protein